MGCDDGYPRSQRDQARDHVRGLVGQAALAASWGRDLLDEYDRRGRELKELRAYISGRLPSDTLRVIKMLVLELGGEFVITDKAACEWKDDDYELVMETGNGLGFDRKLTVRRRMVDIPESYK